MTPNLVISDVDGTLVDKQKRLAEATVAAVARLQGACVPFSLISARPPSGLAKLVERLKLTGPTAAFNGGTILNPDGSIVERHRMSAEVVATSFAIAKSSAATPWLFVDGRWHTVDPDNPHVAHERIASDQEPLIESLDDIPKGEADKLTWVSDDPALLRDLHAKMDAAIGGDATIAQSQTYYLDLTHPLANKGDGIAALARLAGIELSAVAVLGDMPNDLPMFRRAGLAIAMGQAPKEVRDAARYTSTSNDEDGVAHAIDTILLPMIKGDR